MKWDAKTIVALTGLVSVLLGGLEMRLTVNRIEDKLVRVEERLVRVERELAPSTVASNQE